MAILDDLFNAFMNYANTYVKLDIIDLTLDPGKGTVWNVGDTGYFRVRVTNTGTLDIKKMALHITGSPWGKVQSAHNLPAGSVPYADWFYTPEIDLDAHATTILGLPFNFGFLATAVTPGSPPIPSAAITATVARFDLTLEHLLVDHTGYSTTTKVTEQVAVIAA